MARSETDQIRKQIQLKAPVEKVWRALTDHREFGDWFRVNLQSGFVVGKTTAGNITYPGYEYLRMEVLVKTIEPMTRFAFTWHPAAVDPKVDYSGEPSTLVEFTLESRGEETLLTVTESGFDALPDARRDEAFRMNDGGWSEQVKNIQSHVSENV